MPAMDALGGILELEDKTVEKHLFQTDFLLFPERLFDTHWKNVYNEKVQYRTMDEAP